MKDRMAKNPLCAMTQSTAPTLSTSFGHLKSLISRFDLIPDKVDSFAIRKKRVPKVSNRDDRYGPMNPVQRQPQVECLVADIGWHLGSNSARVPKENNSRDPRTYFWPELLDCLANNRGSLTIPCETCQRIEKLKNEEISKIVPQRTIFFSGLCLTALCTASTIF